MGVSSIYNFNELGKKETYGIRKINREVGKVKAEQQTGIL
jgi:hypothetical protein